MPHDTCHEFTRSTCRRFAARASAYLLIVSLVWAAIATQYPVAAQDRPLGQANASVMGLLRLASRIAGFDSHGTGTEQTNADKDG